MSVKSELIRAYTSLLTPDQRKARAKSVISLDGNLMVTINSPAGIAATASGYTTYTSKDNLCGIVVTKYRASTGKLYGTSSQREWSLMVKPDAEGIATFISPIRNGDRIFFFTRPNTEEQFKLTDIPSIAELARILGLILVEQVPPRFGIFASTQP